MNADSYLVIAGPGHAQTRVLGSRFFGSALPVSGLEEVNAFLEAKKSATTTPPTGAGRHAGAWAKLSSKNPRTPANPTAPPVSP